MMNAMSLISLLLLIVISSSFRYKGHTSMGYRKSRYHVFAADHYQADDIDVDFTNLLADALAQRNSANDSSAECGVSLPTVKEQMDELRKQGDEAVVTAGLGDSLRKFHMHAKQGIQNFRAQKLQTALSDFDMALSSNSTQPLVQRGITLYCLGRYEEAAVQLKKDVERIESSRSYKASDLRLWLSACMNHLQKEKAAIDVLDLNAYATDGVTPLESRHLMKNLLEFFAKGRSLEDMLEIIGRIDTKGNDVQGNIFYGNFYLGLFYESTGDEDMAKAFLEIPCSSSKYSQEDMWYHVPRVLSRERGYGCDNGM